jgi:hypothetical protein
MLDGQGRATVGLPDWFGALNRDYRYQLTPGGGPAPNLHIAAEVSGAQFAIGGGAGQESVLAGHRHPARRVGERAPDPGRGSQAS